MLFCVVVIETIIDINYASIIGADFGVTDAASLKTLRLLRLLDLIVFLFAILDMLFKIIEYSTWKRIKEQRNKKFSEVI